MYVADLLDNDVIIFRIEDGAGVFFLRQDVAGVAVEKLDYPADKMTHLLHG